MPDDIRVKLSFFDHIKTKRVIAKYGTDGAFSILRIWRYAAEYAPKGDLTDFDEVEWKSATGRDTDCMQFVNDLFTPGMNFLDKNKKGRILIHDWKEHQGWVFHADVRSKIARQNVEKRWNPTKTKKKEVNTDSIPPVSESNTKANAPSPSPSPSPSPKEERGAPRGPEKVAFEKAKTAWTQLEEVIKSAVDGNKFVISDPLSLKIIFDLGGRDKVMALHGQNGDLLHQEFIARYSVLEAADFKANSSR